MPENISTHFFDVDGLSFFEPACVLAIGMFDGLHRGHAAVMEETLFLAKKYDALPCVLTFSPHPSAVISMPHRNRAEIIYPDEIRAAKFHKSKIEKVFVKNFTKEFAALSPEEFFAFLEKKFPNLKGIVTGANFVFGKGAKGNCETLSKIAKEKNWAYRAAEGVCELGERISSSRLREAIKRGDMPLFEILAGNPYTACGEIADGLKKGRELGFPTLNLPWNPECKPPFGVYAVVLKKDGRTFEGVANYGVSPTIKAEGSPPLLETHLFERPDFGSGARVCVFLKKFLREEKKFGGVEELKTQMSSDLLAARKLFSR